MTKHCITAYAYTSEEVFVTGFVIKYRKEKPFKVIFIAQKSERKVGVNNIFGICLP